MTLGKTNFNLFFIFLVFTFSLFCISAYDFNEFTGTQDETTGIDIGFNFQPTTSNILSQMLGVCAAGSYVSGFTSDGVKICDVDQVGVGGGGISWAEATNGTLMSQADFNTNYSANDANYRSTYNSTYDAYNSTGLIKDWNVSGYIKNWNASALIINWSQIISSGISWANAVNGTLMLQSTFDANYTANDVAYRNMTNNSYALAGSADTFAGGNYTTFLTHLTWDKIINGTMVNWTYALNGTLFRLTDWNTNYTANNANWLSITNTSYIKWSEAVNNTLMSQATFNTNYTTNDAAYRNATNNTYRINTNGSFTSKINITTGNLSIDTGTFICLDQACSRYIMSNTTGVYIQG